MNEVNQVIGGDRVASRGLSPSRFRDINPSASYLSGKLKDKMCVNNPLPTNTHTLDEVTDNSRVEIPHIPREKLCCIAATFLEGARHACKKMVATSWLYSHSYLT
jgi:hypothetical protein